MNYIDLHVHSTASDGTMKPSEIVEYASIKGLKAIALTDHDTISGLETATLSADHFGIKFISGIEMSCLYNGSEVHILGYFINSHDTSMISDLKEFTDSRDERNRVLLDNLAKDGIYITKDELTLGNPDTIITRAHFSRVLCARGYVSNNQKAFDSFLKLGGRYCPTKKDINTHDVLAFFKKYKIWSSLAHPIQYKLSDKKLEELIINLKNDGLNGIEVYHSSYRMGDTAKLMKLSHKYSLLPTGGSDFHGSNKPNIDIGIGYGGLKIPEIILDDMIDDYNKSIQLD